MPAPEVEEFAVSLMSHVRDAAIASCDNLLDSEANSVVAKRWRTALDRGSLADLAKMMIPDCIDQAMFFLLHAIDTGVLKVSFVSSDGNIVDLMQGGQGEMAGLFMATGGWRATFSNERFIDDFADME